MSGTSVDQVSTGRHRWRRVGLGVLIVLVVFGGGLALGALTRGQGPGTSLTSSDPTASCDPVDPTCVAASVAPTPGPSTGPSPGPSQPVSASAAPVPTASTACSGSGGAYSSCRTITPDATTAAGAETKVGQADSGRTVRLRVGQVLVVGLSSDGSWLWSAPQEGDPSVLHRDTSTVNRGSASARFTAIAAGATDVTASGDPACRAATPPCGAPSQLWRVHVVVSG